MSEGPEGGREKGNEIVLLYNVSSSPSSFHHITEIPPRPDPCQGRRARRPRPLSLPPSTFHSKKEGGRGRTGAERGRGGGGGGEGAFGIDVSFWLLCLELSSPSSSPLTPSLPPSLPPSLGPSKTAGFSVSLSYIFPFYPPHLAPPLPCFLPCSLPPSLPPSLPLQDDQRLSVPPSFLFTNLWRGDHSFSSFFLFLREGGRQGGREGGRAVEAVWVLQAEVRGEGGREGGGAA